MNWHENELYRFPDEGMAGGVCLGVSRYLDVDVAIVRAVFIGSLVFSGVGAVLYLALWFLVSRPPDIVPPCAVEGGGQDEVDLDVKDPSQAPGDVNGS